MKAYDNDVLNNKCIPLPLDQSDRGHRIQIMFIIRDQSIVIGKMVDKISVKLKTMYKFFMHITKHVKYI